MRQPEMEAQIPCALYTFEIYLYHSTIPPIRQAVFHRKRQKFLGVKFLILRILIYAKEL